MNTLVSNEHRCGVSLITTVDELTPDIIADEPEWT